MCILGIALTSILPTAEAAATIAPFTAVLLSFISGVFNPVEQLPNWLEEIGRVFPLAATWPRGVTGARCRRESGKSVENLSLHGWTVPSWAARA